MASHSGSQSEAAEELRVVAILDNLDAVRDMIEKRLLGANCPEAAATAILVIAEEAFVNIANYAYPGSRGEVAVRCRTAPGEAFLEFRDSGLGFDPTEFRDTRQDLPSGERPPGGLGIVLMRKIADEMSYRRVDGINVLTLRKRWKASPAQEASPP